MATTQSRLATGKKVNSALDNPTNFFTAQSLQSRAGDLNSLLDSMSNGTKTLEAADNGLTSITKTVEAMRPPCVRLARTSPSRPKASLDPARSGNVSFSGGAVGATTVNVALGTSPTATTLAGTGAAFGTSTGGAIGRRLNVTIRGDAAATATTLAGTSANFGTPTSPAASSP